VAVFGMFAASVRVLEGHEVPADRRMVLCAPLLEDEV
jgi:hypothetical protein